MKNNNIDAKKVMEIINTNLAGLKKEYDPSLFTKEENNKIDNELEELEKLALKAKLQFQQRKMVKLVEQYNENLEREISKLSSQQLNVLGKDTMSVNENLESLQKVITKAA